MRRERPGTSSPPLSRRVSLRQTALAGSSGRIFGSRAHSCPQAPIQRRQRPTHGLRLCKLVILSRSAPQPCDRPIRRWPSPRRRPHWPRPRPPAPTGDGYATPHPEKNTPSTQKHRAPRRAVPRARDATTCTATHDGSLLTLESGSLFLLGPSPKRPRNCERASYRSDASRLRASTTAG